MKVMEFFGFYDSGESMEARAAQQTSYSPQPATPIRSFMRKRQGETGQILTFTPTSYKEATVITESLRNQVPVILNINLMNKSEALRIIDFCAGAVKALDGKIKRVTPHVFIVAPYGVALDNDEEQDTVQTQTDESILEELYQRDNARVA